MFIADRHRCRLFKAIRFVSIALLFRIAGSETRDWCVCIVLVEFHLISIALLFVVVPLLWLRCGLFALWLIIVG